MGNGFEESELREPKKALEDAGAQVDIVSLESGTIKSWTDGNWGKTYTVDKTLDGVSHSDYNALMLPGGVINPDLLRKNELIILKILKMENLNKKRVAIL